MKSLDYDFLRKLSFSMGLNKVSDDWVISMIFLLSLSDIFYFLSSYHASAKVTTVRNNLQLLILS